MMRQYQAQKRRHPDAILLFRMGDFYEMFFDDAAKAARILEIALTSRDKNRDERVPMCGFPYHSASAYISRLLAAGERVAVCDQMEDPRKAKGIVRREVTRVLTPGLAEEPGSLQSDENLFVLGLSFRNKRYGLAAFDLSTGDFLVTETDRQGLAAQEVTRLEPREVLIPAEMAETGPLTLLLNDAHYVQPLEDWMTDDRSCVDVLKDQFRVHSLAGFGLDEASAASLAAGSVMNYVRHSRIELPAHIKPPRVYHLGTFMVLDHGTVRNLEIFRNLKDGSAKGTLLKLLDTTCTAMGARLLKHWIRYPLMDVDAVNGRLDAVEALITHTIARRQVRDLLKELGDLERIAGKIALRSANPRDLVQLRLSAEQLPALIKALDQLQSGVLADIHAMDDLSYVAHAIAAVIVDQPPMHLRDGGVIRPEYDEELDELRSMSTRGKEWIAGIEARERERTGIPKLKVGYNKVFGYYIEVTKAHQDKIPADYIRKQTLVNAERYVTEDLKEYELKVLNAQERIIELEEQIFLRLRDRLLEVIPRIQQTALYVATLDTLAALADVSAKRGYTRPEVHDGDEIQIVAGRHPVVEAFETTDSYVANDASLNRSTEQILIITGPNMAGKSTYMRQAALIVLLGHIGSFVPAKSASIGLVDRIFTRIGAADYLSFGQSTFMVEMNETADILHNSTTRSLVLLDEVGRGTSTFDGLSIAWAVVEYLHDRHDGGPRTLFATHYHELVELARTKSRVRVYHVTVRETGDKIVFLRTIVPGGTSRSYGIQVARLAGIPNAVTRRAEEILTELEQGKSELSRAPQETGEHQRRKGNAAPAVQASLFSSIGDTFIDELVATDLNSLTPLDALNLLSDWKKRLT
jgi:DNA mismatch repair protein MutS